MMKRSGKSYANGLLIGMTMLSLAVAPGFAYAEDVVGTTSAMPPSTSGMTPEERREEFMRMREERMAERRKMIEERRTGIQSQTNVRANDAQANQLKREEMKSNREEASCDKMIETIGKHMEKAGEKKQDIAERFGEKISAFEEGRDQRDANLNSDRQGQDEHRDEMYANLLAKATTDEQKAAVEKFQKTVEAAVDVRREAVDAAIEAFRNGVDDAVTSKKMTTSGYAETFQSQMTNAYNTLKSECSSGTDPKMAREHFMKSLKDGRLAFQDGRQSFDKVGSMVSSLAEDKKLAIDKAMETFRATMEQARTELKAAFGEERVQERPTSASGSTSASQ